MFYRIFLSPQVKRCSIITYKHGISELPYKLPNELRLSSPLGRPLCPHKKKKILHKWENGFTMNIRNTPIDRPCYEAIDSLISQDIFSYLKMFSMQYRKNRVEDNKKRMNIASYINVYTLAICDKNDSK